MGVPDGAREALAAGWAADRIAQWGLATGYGATALAEAWAAGIERDLSAAGYVVVRAEETWTDYGVRSMASGAVREGMSSLAAAEGAWDAGSAADTIVQREVSAGPWVPVSGEEQP